MPCLWSMCSWNWACFFHFHCFGCQAHDSTVLYKCLAPLEITIQWSWVGFDLAWAFRYFALPFSVSVGYKWTYLLIHKIFMVLCSVVQHMPSVLGVVGMGVLPAQKKRMSMVPCASITCLNYMRVSITVFCLLCSLHYTAGMVLCAWVIIWNWTTFSVSYVY